MLQGWHGKYLGTVHTVYKPRVELLPSRKLAIVKLHNLKAAVSAKIGTVFYSLREN